MLKFDYLHLEFSDCNYIPLYTSTHDAKPFYKIHQNPLRILFERSLKIQIFTLKLLPGNHNDQDDNDITIAINICKCFQLYKKGIHVLKYVKFYIFIGQIVFKELNDTGCMPLQFLYQSTQPNVPHKTSIWCSILMIIIRKSYDNHMIFNI